ncbi:helix-turn-helix domain-containing protein [Candidatus Uhrbacteria bacterium]|nr:helix-turn-helix domain-containing protein [Candidatus Uhrbacteria bacterium]
MPELVKKTDLPIRLYVSEAAKLFGVSDRTIRRAISRREIRYIIVRNRYQIHFESMLNWSQQKPRLQKKRDQIGLGQWVQKWKITNPKFSPRPPSRAKASERK